MTTKTTHVRFGATGDLSLASGVNQKIAEKGPDFPFQKINGALRGHDILFCNLENIYSDCTEAVGSQAHNLKSSPRSIDGIHNAGFNVVSLANNHIYDFAQQGITDTISALDSRNIKHTGAAMNLDMARDPAILESKGIKFGFLAYAMNGIHTATATKSGAAVIDYEQIRQDIEGLQTKVDIIIISLHYGLEFIDYPSPEFRELCLKIAALGPSLILGHHPHVVNGFEKTRNCLIAYSLGNFIFDSKIMDYKTESTQQSMILSCTFDKTGLLEYSIIPAVINSEFQPEIADKKMSEFITAKIARISSELKSEAYPAIYYKQANYLWPRINIMVNLRLIRQQGLIAFLKRMPRIKKKYILMLLNFLAAKAFPTFKK